MGLKLEILKGQENYTRWERDSKIIAGAKGVQKFYTGSEEILTEPQLADYVPTIPKERSH